jgi:predicted PurR-regulated permease PerM
MPLQIDGITLAMPLSMSTIIAIIIFILIKNTKKMEEHKIEKQRAVCSIAISLVSLIAIAGFIVAYMQYDQKKDAMAQATEALNAQEKRVMESYDRISNLAKIRQYENVIKGI